MEPNRTLALALALTALLAAGCGARTKDQVPTLKCDRLTHGLIATARVAVIVRATPERDGKPLYRVLRGTTLRLVKRPNDRNWAPVRCVKTGRDPVGHVPWGENGVTW